MNLAKNVLHLLFEFARVRRHVPATWFNPCTGRKNYKGTPGEKRRIPASEFPQLLDATKNPRDRIVVALGLYLLLRQSEMKELRLGDVDLHHGEVAVRVLKSNKFDVMPITVELDKELRRWLTFYAERAGELQDRWHLVPAKSPYKVTRESVHHPYRVDTDMYEFRPEKPYGEPHNAVIAAVAALGYATYNERGEMHRDGVHTLRRSGALAIYTRLSSEGHDRAMGTVQEWLHHSSVRTTELYVGTDVNRKLRNDLFRGKEMYPMAPQANVIRLEDHRG
jgi:integrase